MSRSRFRLHLSISSISLVPLLAVATPAAGQCTGDSPDTDCNANGIPDACELAGVVTLQSGHMGPLDYATPQTFAVDGAPEALEDLVITFNASADLSNWTERVDVWINETPMQSVFLFSLDCYESAQSFLLSRDLYNSAAASGKVAIGMYPSAAVDPGYCSDSFIDVTLEMMTHAAADENGNGVLDECEEAESTLCEGLEPTVYVDEEGFVVGGPLDGKPYFGVLIGTNGDDVMMGTDANDMIVPGRGNDTVCGNGGDDKVAGAKSRGQGRN